MAKANWVKVDPSQGSGDATVKVSSIAEHSGRKILQFVTPQVIQ